jgi:hypothetical protein
MQKVNYRNITRGSVVGATSSISVDRNSFSRRWGGRLQVLGFAASGLCTTNILTDAPSGSARYTKLGTPPEEHFIIRLYGLKSRVSFFVQRHKHMRIIVLRHIHGGIILGREDVLAQRAVYVNELHFRFQDRLNLFGRIVATQFFLTKPLLVWPFL